MCLITSQKKPIFIEFTIDSEPHEDGLYRFTWMDGHVFTATYRKISMSTTEHNNVKKTERFLIENNNISNLNIHK